MARSRTTYRPGVSGNPSGRPRISAEIRDAAREHGPACITKLVQMAGLNGAHGARNEAVRLGALRELLDRGYGKATTVIAGDDQVAPTAFDFRWADATTAPAASASAEPGAQQLHQVAATADESTEALGISWDEDASPLN